MKLSTIQKRNNLNEVHCHDSDVPGPGGACHEYSIKLPTEGGDLIELLYLAFQKGARKDPEARHGILDTDLLEIVRHRLQCVQAGEFACRENALALTALEECLLWMNKRVEDRAERQVLGTYNK